MKVIRFFILNGPNLNLLGHREPEKYGRVTLDQIIHKLQSNFLTKFKQSNLNFVQHDDKEKLQVLVENQNLGFELHSFQSNHEGALIDYLHRTFLEKLSSANKYEDYFIINPAAFGHTSVALRDALLAIEAKFVEVHLSNIHSREEFRHHTYLQNIAQGVICGLGAKGYELALEYWLEQLDIFSK
ncbi:hypothetical protein CKF54_01680 [Psittacicella hinzii]|uniref:3-dehydroquinate dehydratase n=1 Tax=Psittacicella hinzii TaxID=2028575 RepID=A0A3A1YDE9_9GAMM|nr:type II 3-dehydroquinate dehydratase [Psittacicella hinzii]RIY34167.1 hypothetical protein CKF54_01680 [Psittacicella hinzii]